jgi:hypothetical protein
MDPTEPRGWPPLPERPAAPPAAPWPDWSQPPGAAPPGPPGWGAPPPPRPGRRSGWVLAGVAALLAVALVASVLVLRPSLQVGSAPRALGGKPAGGLPADPQVAAQRLLTKRAKAVLGNNRAAFLATVDKRRKRWYRAQATLFARMRTVPFSALAYRVTGPRNHAGSRVTRRYAPDRVYLPEVEARYRLKGQDQRPVLGRLFYTFVQTGSGWRIASHGEAGRQDVEIWDSGLVKTLRRARTLVVYHPGSEELAGRLLQAAERAYGQVAATWPYRWDRKVVILVPRDEAEGERLVARDLSRVAALVHAQTSNGRTLGNRLVVNSSKLPGYDPLNLQLVITHEMTHVATYTLGDGVPLLLVEGFADYTALRPHRLSLAESRPVLAEQVRNGRFDGTLPGNDDLLGRDTPLAYDSASSFCLWVAESFGEQRLRALYRVFATSIAPSAANLDRGLRRVLGLSRRTAETRWAAWVRERL